MEISSKRGFQKYLEVTSNVRSLMIQVTEEEEGLGVRVTLVSTGPVGRTDVMEHSPLVLRVRRVLYVISG